MVRSLIRFEGEALPADWTILSKADRAMEVHLALVADAAAEALRGIAAAAEALGRIK